VIAVACVLLVGSRENCFFRMSAYVWQVAVCTGLSSLCGKREDGRSIPSGINFRMSCSKFTSIQAQVSGRLDFVVTRIHFCQVTCSTC